MISVCLSTAQVISIFQCVTSSLIIYDSTHQLIEWFTITLAARFLGRGTDNHVLSNDLSCIKHQIVISAYYDGRCVPYSDENEHEVYYISNQKTLM